MTDFDYSNTGIYTKRNSERSKNFNERLNALYTVFFQHMKKRESEIRECEKKDTSFLCTDYNGIQLLTCFDSYLNSENKIMCYGKEAHHGEGKIFDFPAYYQDDYYYKYDYAIAHRYDKYSPISASDCPQTEYLKTRKLICGFCATDLPEEREAEILSVLNNNLNKTSLKGKYTPCYPSVVNRKTKSYLRCKTRDDIVYSDFEFEGVSRNIFLHELNILHPTHLIFLSGTGYDNHIIRDFGEEFYTEKIAPLIRSLTPDEPTTINRPCELSPEEIKDWFRINDYDSSIKILYAYHPSAHLSSSREKYNKGLCDFSGHTYAMNSGMTK